jgi:pimeloyl-ACP methyl ester carboxylesterase
MILLSREDLVYPVAIQAEMATLFPAARQIIVYIEDCGHLSTLEQPGKVTAALEAWLLYGV